MKLKTLSFLTSFLFVISLIVYAQENKRGSDLAEGAEFIKGININSVEKIKLTVSGIAQPISLQRDGTRFVLANHKNYPAASERVNSLIFSISNILVKEKIESNASEDDLKEYELGIDNKKILVEFFDKNEKQTLAFRLGKNHPKKGTYLFKEGSKDIYLSKNSIFLNRSYKDFVDQMILAAKSSDIKEIVIDGNSDKKFIQDGNSFKIGEADSKIKLKEDSLKKLTGELASLRFKEFFARSEKEVANLVFTKRLDLTLKNQMRYSLQLGGTGGKYFLRASSDTGEMPTKVTVSQDDGKEELQKIEDMVQAQGLSQQFNIEKGNWIYEIDKSVYDNLTRKLTDYL